MKPRYINLAVLSTLIVIVLATYALVGPGFAFECVVTLLGLGWCAQFIALVWSARRGRSPQFTSPLLSAIWAAAIYPMIGLMRPGMFPDWFIYASIPVGFVLAYIVISAVLGASRAQSRWISPLRDPRPPSD